MNKNQNIFVVAILFVAFVTASYFNYKNQNDDELKVYIAFFDDPLIKPHLDKVVFVSSVSTCGIDLLDLNGDKELFENMTKTNSSVAHPKALSELTTHVSVVEHSIAKLHNENIISSISIKKELRNLSRVGFNKMKDRAVFCMEGRHSASIIISSKESNGKWKTDEARMLWTQ